MVSEVRGSNEHGWHNLGWDPRHLFSFGPPSLTSCALGASHGKILMPKIFQVNLSSGRFLKYKKFTK
jgi:hypothetical protein